MEFKGSRKDFEYVVGLCAENIVLKAALQARGVDTSNPVTVLQSQFPPALPPAPTPYALPPSQPSILMNPAAITVPVADSEPILPAPPTIIHSPAPVRSPFPVRAIAITISIVGAIAIGGFLSASANRSWVIETFIRGVQLERQSEPTSDPRPEAGVEAEVQPIPVPAPPPPPSNPSETLQDHFESPVGPVIYEHTI